MSEGTQISEVTLMSDVTLMSKATQTRQKATYAVRRWPFDVEPTMGFEPATYALRKHCSTN